MLLAGIPVRGDLVLELARLVDDPEVATRLEDCYARDVKVLALDIPERETIIRALEDAPAGLEELRGGALARARVAAPRRPVNVGWKDNGSETTPGPHEHGISR